MFTGIIEETGFVKEVRQGTNSASLKIEAKVILKGMKSGDSINTDGVCLTVIEFDHNTFRVEVMAETMRMTNLGSLKPGDSVNLERAMILNSRLGGHMLSGHIDGTGTISAIEKEDIATWLHIRADAEIMKYIVLKGSVAIDGISLTVAGISQDGFSVSLIPHTSKMTALHDKKPTEKVNIECDMIAKYVEKFISGKNENPARSIDLNYLKEHGFIEENNERF